MIHRIPFCKHCYITLWEASFSDGEK